jgi:hypothetical protein
VAAGHVREVAVRRHAIGSEQRFASVVGGIFGGVSRLDTGALVSGLAARDSCEQVSFVVQQAQGSAGLLRFLQPGLDPVLTLDPQAPDRAGRRMVGLIAGNPLTMGQLTRHVADASSSAPVTILIQELPGGRTRVGYDAVTSAIAPDHDAAASKAAARLDAWVLTLLRQVSAVPESATS